MKTPQTTVAVSGALLPPDIATAPQHVRERYLSYVSAGQSPKLAEMFALQAAPRALTDRELFHGKGTLADQFHNNDEQLQHVVSSARAHGYEPSYTDSYEPFMARFPGDPQAFVPATGGRGHIKKVLEARDVPDLTGTVKVNRKHLPPTPDVPLDNPIGQRLAREAIAKDPQLGKVHPQEIKQEIIRRHTAK